MITEDYVSFETSKLLKEKEFNEKVLSYYDTEGQGYFLSPRECNIGTGSVYAAPTLQMAMKWLRLEHSLYIEPMVIKNYDKKKLEYTYTIQDLNFPGSDDGIDSCKNWDTPEEAIGEAIKYCLEHLI